MKNERHKEKICIKLEPRTSSVTSWSNYKLKSGVKKPLFLFIKLSEELNYLYTVLLQNVIQPFCSDENKTHATLSHPKSGHCDSCLTVLAEF